MHFVTILSVGIGGAVGAISRYLVSVYFNNQTAIKTDFPISTFLINIVGCFLIGLFYGLTLKFNLSDNVKAFISVGFLGAFTTFSTFSLENILLLKEGQFLTLFMYLSISVITGLFLVYLGLKLTAWYFNFYKLYKVENP